MWIYLWKYKKYTVKQLKTWGRGAHVCVCVYRNLFKSTVESSRTTRRKQKTGYCLPSSLNRSNLILRRILCKQTQIHPISDAVAVNSRVHFTVKHRHHQQQYEGNCSKTP